MLSRLTALLAFNTLAINLKKARPGKRPSLTVVFVRHQSRQSLIVFLDIWLCYIILMKLKTLKNLKGINFPSKPVLTYIARLPPGGSQQRGAPAT
jgi:hypothetical protein